jgi:opacity protein-like surface antigen
MRKLMLAAVVAVLGLPAAMAGEWYNATARGKVDGNEKTVTATIMIDRFSTQAEKDKARAAFDAGGTAGLAATLNTMSSVGKLTLEDGRVFDLKLTNEIKVLGGARFLTAITAKPIAFLGTDKPDTKPIKDYAVGVIDLNLEPNGDGTGTAAPAAKVKIGDRGGFQVEDYGSKTIWLEGIRKK